MRKSIFVFLFIIKVLFIEAQLLPGFKLTESHGEQQMLLENAINNTRILVNAPKQGFGKNNQVLLVFYALPNGNTIEQSFGKKLKDGDDWHYNIQHIGAQTRFLRKILKNQTVVVVYLEAKQKSWPLWKKENPHFLQDSKNIVDKITAMFSQWNPQLVLNGHSGGGRFIFSYLESVKTIPAAVKRIAFLDSNYGYEDTIHGPILTKWLKSDKKNCLTVIAYNDSVALYNNKPIVSPTGGTWYRTKMMQNYLGKHFHLTVRANDSLIWYKSSGRKIELILKTNPDKKIYHTIQVELNGFIHSILSGTCYEQKKYTYFGQRAYSDLIADTINIPNRSLNIPTRENDATSGSSFMKRIANLSLNERENEIYKALSTGNMPEFLKKMFRIEDEFADASGKLHEVQYEVMPDYLSVGNDTDFCRIPMNPHTAQKLATLFGASLITAKLSDNIYKMAQLKLTPFPYKPVNNENELIAKFIEHNDQIEKQKAELGGLNGQLVAGIKKDIILSKHIATHPNKVVIYGWHKPDGIAIQPVYSGHIDWYVDYSHGIRLINNQILLDGKAVLFTDILSDPVLFKIFSDEDSPLSETVYK